MANINIGSDSSDAFARYKMPRLISKVESSGNGIKTAIMNMVDICKHLGVPEAYPTKFMSFQLGAQATFDKGSDRTIITGSHATNTLKTILEQFIDQFVLCPDCRLPETSLQVKKNRLLMHCAACPYSGDMDATDKLVSFIIKHSKSSKGLSKKKRREKKKTGVDDGETSSQRRDRRNKRKIRKEAEAEEVPITTTTEVETGTDPQVEWFADTSDEAKKIRLQEEIHALGVRDTSADANLQQRVDAIVGKQAPTKCGLLPAEAVLLEFVSTDPSPTVDEFLSEAKRVQLARSLDTEELQQCIVRGLLDFELVKKIGKQIISRSRFLRTFSQDIVSSSLLINAFEREICKSSALIQKTAVILKTLYDEDVLSEECLVNWYQAPAISSKGVSSEDAEAMRVVAKPFVDWLLVATDEEEEEDDDDEEEETKED